MVKKAAKGKRKKKDTVEEENINELELEEEEKEEVVFTDTSYTSASFESFTLYDDVSMTSSIQRSTKSKPHKRKKRLVRQESPKVVKSEVKFVWSDEDFDLTIGRDPGSSLFVPEPELQHVEQEETQSERRDSKSKKKLDYPQFAKPSGWDSMSKPQRKEWLENKIEEYEKEKEAKKQEALATIKMKRKALADKRQELMRKDEAELAESKRMLTIIFQQFKKFKKMLIDSHFDKLKKNQWRRYLLCDGIPNAHIVRELNLYLHHWRLDRNRYAPDNVAQRLKVVLPILDQLNEQIASTRIYTEEQIKNFIELQIQFRAEMVDTVETIAYYLLRKIENNMKIESTGSQIFTYQRTFRDLNLNLWVAMKTYSKKKTKADFRPLELHFPGVKATIRLPTTFGKCDFCVRAAHFGLDLLSEFSRTSPLPIKIPDQDLDLLEMNEVEHIETYKLKEKYDIIRDEFYKETKKKIRELKQQIAANAFVRHDEEREEIDRLQLAEPPQLKGPDAEDPRILVNAQYDRTYRRYLKSMQIRLRIGEVNLRKYRILNGMINLDVLRMPPQTKRCPCEVEMATVLLPRTLHHMPFHVRYREPPPIPAELDTRRNLQKASDIAILREKLDDLVQMIIELPAKLMFFELPIVCQWYPAKKMWTTIYINDYHFNETTRVIKFSTGTLWPIAFASSRYINFPLVDWEIRPEPSGPGVLITVEGVYIKLTWLIRDTKIRLTEVDKYETHTLEDVLDQPMSIGQMKKLLRERGCDFFPDYDGYIYAEGSCPKLWPMERHNYHVMALLSRAYNFKKSKWNLQAGYRDLIIQIREMYSTKFVFKWELLRVTPRSVTLLKHREDTMPYVSSEDRHRFNTEPMACMRFSPDLFSLCVQYGSLDVKRIILNMKYSVTETVYEMLLALKLCSF